MSIFRHIPMGIMGSVFFYMLFGVISISELIERNVPLKPNYIDHQQVSSELIIDKRENTLQITGEITNYRTDAIELNYQLHAERTGKSGSSASRQSSTVMIGSGQKSGISKVNFNVGTADTCRIELKVWDQQEEVVSTSNLVLKFN